MWRTRPHEIPLSVTSKKKCRWLTGPSFLKLPKDEWPKEKEKIKIQDFDNMEELELKREQVCVTIEASSRATLPDIEKFASYLQLIRTTAWVSRFVKNIRLENNLRLKSELNRAEFLEAEIKWFKQVQSESFSGDIEALKKRNQVEKSSRLFTLLPFLDGQGLLRLKGRTQNSIEMTAEMKNPIILDSKHPFTRLLIHHYHVRAGHIGQETVANELRRRFWIIDIRAAVRGVWSRCQKCKLGRATTCQPHMGQLPHCRLQKFDRPFSVTGFDYFGPMEIRVGRRREKRYGALFTCLSTRAVHLELASSLTTDSAIMAIRRFISRRGNPTAIYSDNGTNFRGADAELKKALQDFDQEKLKREMTTRGIDWHFIPPAAPHMGGSWKRLVRSVKTALKITLKEQAPKEEVLRTVLTEAEHSVNCRPLTYLSVDPNDDECLTPNHFLIGSSSGVRTPGVFTNADMCLKKQWRTAQQLSDNFWRRWMQEYLPTLIRRTKWHRNVKPVKQGDLVVIVDHNLERNYWPRGKIVKLYPGQDGITRVVDVKTKTGIFKRPVVKLCVMDVDADDESKRGEADVPLPPSGREGCSRGLKTSVIGNESGARDWTRRREKKKEPTDRLALERGRD